jgi:hypothetical protein
MKAPKFISDLAEKFEDEAPKETIVGAKISTVAFLSGWVGIGVLVAGYEGIGKVIVWISMFSFFCGFFLMAFGFFTKLADDREDKKNYLRKYENPKQPWE